MGWSDHPTPTPSRNLKRGLDTPPHPSDHCERTLSRRAGGERSGTPPPRGDVVLPPFPSHTSLLATARAHRAAAEPRRRHALPVAGSTSNTGFQLLQRLGKCKGYFLHSRSDLNLCIDKSIFILNFEKILTSIRYCWIG